MSDRHDVDRYLGALFGDAPAGSLIELRWRTQRGMGRAFFDVSRRDATAAAICRRGVVTDVYVGLLPRARHGGGRADLIETGAVLWVDCDTPRSVTALDSFARQPAVRIASGSGIHRHAVWLLTSPVTWDEIEAANRALAHTLGADQACTGAAAILRPPSWNHKHEPPTQVRLLDCDPGRRTPIGDLLDVCEEVPCSHSPGAHRASARTHDDPLLDVPPAVYVEAITGLRPGRTRKVSCPFHEDWTPSLHVYDEPARGWFCFSCRRGGSVYDLAAAWYGVPARGDGFRELQQRLDALLHPLVDLSMPHS